MKDHVKGFIRKGQAFGHIRPQGNDIISFAVSDHFFGVDLFLRIIQNGTLSFQRTEDWHLLTASRS
ncbi:hypothetical protein SDC9_167628 [bioreactor metagenome]|uniref:Uncharacterized protein n=1 Tax=bioreactor metagenome TaxID=1076179 RepID=A0A645G2X0_9ZZZZ